MATAEIVKSEVGGVLLPPMPQISVVESFKIMELCEADRAEGSAIAVTSPETYELAVQFGKKIGERMKAIKAFVRGTLPLGNPNNHSPLAMVDKVRTAITEFEADLLKPYETLDAKLKADATKWRVEQQRIANEAAAKERATLQRESEDRRIAEAEKAASLGATTLADKLLSTPVAAPKVEAEKVGAGTGAKARKVWKFEITDADKISRSFMKPDEQKIGEYVRHNKEQAIDAIPGVRVYSEDATSW